MTLIATHPARLRPDPLRHRPPHRRRILEPSASPIIERDGLERSALIVVRFSESFRTEKPAGDGGVANMVVRQDPRVRRHLRRLRDGDIRRRRQGSHADALCVVGSVIGTTRRSGAGLAISYHDAGSP